MTAQLHLPDLLQVERQADGRFRVHQPEISQEGRDVVFGGQLMAQAIMAAYAESDGTKYLKGLNTIFVRAGTHKQPIDIEIEPVQRGRTWASSVITAWQAGKVLTKATALMTGDDPDLISHGPQIPDGIPRPDALASTGEDGIVFPGAELRSVPGWGEGADVPELAFWTRLPGVSDLAASQAVATWATNGWLIGLAMRPHRDKVDISNAHHSLSTGVIAHNVSFERDIDASQWLLVVQQATFAGRGRVHGRGQIFDESGQLAATFTQESMVKTMDPERAGSL